MSCPPDAMKLKDAPLYMQWLCNYTKTGTQRFFCDGQYPKDALALAAAAGHVDWASPSPWADPERCGPPLVPL
jgi:hypothetical protein